MGFGIPQEIFKETCQRPLIVNKETQAETKSRLRGLISTGACPDFMGANLLPLAESVSHSCGMPKPITPARPEREKFKALALIIHLKRTATGCVTL